MSLREDIADIFGQPALNDITFKSTEAINGGTLHNKSFDSRSSSRSISTTTCFCRDSTVDVFNSNPFTHSSTPRGNRNGRDSWLIPLRLQSPRTDYSTYGESDSQDLITIETKLRIRKKMNKFWDLREDNFKIRVSNMARCHDSIHQKYKHVAEKYTKAKGVIKYLKPYKQTVKQYKNLYGSLPLKRHALSDSESMLRQNMSRYKNMICIPVTEQSRSRKFFEATGSTKETVQDVRHEWDSSNASNQLASQLRKMIISPSSAFGSGMVRQEPKMLDYGRKRVSAQRRSSQSSETITRKSNKEELQDMRHEWDSSFASNQLGDPIKKKNTSSSSLSGSKNHFGSCIAKQDSKISDYERGLRSRIPAQRRRSQSSDNTNRKSNKEKVQDMRHEWDSSFASNQLGDPIKKKNTSSSSLMSGSKNHFGSCIAKQDSKISDYERGLRSRIPAQRRRSQSSDNTNRKSNKEKVQDMRHEWDSSFASNQLGDPIKKKNTSSSSLMSGSKNHFGSCIAKQDSKISDYERGLRSRIPAQRRRSQSSDNTNRKSKREKVQDMRHEWDFSFAKKISISPSSTMSRSKNHLGSGIVRQEPKMLNYEINQVSAQRCSSQSSDNTNRKSNKEKVQDMRHEWDSSFASNQLGDPIKKKNTSSSSLMSGSKNHFGSCIAKQDSKISDYERGLRSRIPAQRRRSQSSDNTNRKSKREKVQDMRHEWDFSFAKKISISPSSTMSRSKNHLGSGIVRQEPKMLNYEINQVSAQRCSSQSSENTKRKSNKEKVQDMRHEWDSFVASNQLDDPIKKINTSSSSFITGSKNHFGSCIAKQDSKISDYERRMRNRIPAQRPSSQSSENTKRKSNEEKVQYMRHEWESSSASNQLDGRIKKINTSPSSTIAGSKNDNPFTKESCAGKPSFNIPLDFFSDTYPLCKPPVPSPKLEKTAETKPQFSLKQTSVDVNKSQQEFRITGSLLQQCRASLRKTKCGDPSFRNPSYPEVNDVQTDNVPQGRYKTYVDLYGTSGGLPMAYPDIKPSDRLVGRGKVAAYPGSHGTGQGIFVDNPAYNFCGTSPGGAVAHKRHSLASGPGIPVSNPHYDHTLATGQEEKWLYHAVAKPVPMGTVMKPIVPNIKFVKMQPKFKDITDGKTSKYCLMSQEQDSDGEFETKMYKGNVVPTCGGGAQVIFNDVEMLKQSSPDVARKQFKGKGTTSKW